MGDNDETREIDLPKESPTLNLELLKRQALGLCLYSAIEFTCNRAYDCVDIEKYAGSEDKNKEKTHKMRMQRITLLNQITNGQYNGQGTYF